MTIRFKCPSCQKPLGVADHLAGKKAACPVCKKALVIPTPVDVEALVAASFADAPVEKAAPVPTFVDFTCPHCDEELHLSAELAGKKTPCPSCKHIIRVPLPDDKKPKDWRSVQTAGPTLAATNQPGQLEGAWGSTTDKAKVSTKALVEAGAIVEAPKPGIGALGWIKRGFMTAAVLSVVGLGLWGANRRVEVKHEKDAFAEALKIVEPTNKLTPLLTAAVYRSIGELALHRDKPRDAVTYFLKALAALPSTPASSAAKLAHDLFLTDLALTMIDLGGTDQQVNAKSRLSWEDTLKQLQRAFAPMLTDEVRLAGLREVAGRLLDRGQPTIAVSLTNTVMASNPGPDGARSPVLAEQVAVLLVVPSGASRVSIKQPDLTPRDKDDKTVIDTVARQAYAEAAARKGDLAAAMALTQARGQPWARLDTALAVASIARAEKRNAEEAAKFIKEAYEIYDKDYKDKASTWQVIQLIRLSAGSEFAVRNKDLLAKLDTPDRALTQYLLLRDDWEQSVGPASPTALEEIDEKETEVRALAWEALARHNARMGLPSAPADSITDERYKAMIGIGAALGDKDRH